MNRKILYRIEAVAEFVEWINDDVARGHKRHSRMTTEERAMWASFPELVRAHPTNHVFLEPDRPILEYLLSGRIGPNAIPGVAVAG
jgi:hypothetical protein